MSRSGSSQPVFLRAWLVWTAGFVAFPVAGLAGTAAGGRVDGPIAALLGGMVAGLLLGAGADAGLPSPPRCAPMDPGHRHRHGPRTAPRSLCRRVRHITG